MGQTLQKYQSGIIEMYDKLKLKTDGKNYNFTQLSIKYNPEISKYNPRLDLMYTK